MFPIPQSNKVLLYREPSGRVHSLLPLTVRCRSHSEAAGPTPPLPPPRTVGAGSSLPQTCSSESTKQSISLLQISNKSLTLYYGLKVANTERVINSFN